MRGQLISQPSGFASVLTDVQLVSGKTTRVQTAMEAEWFNETRDQYLAQTKFTETTDLRDLDRLLVLELMIFRWTQQLSAGVDYEGFEVNAEQLRRNVKEYSDQLNKIKESMGLSKKTRDDAANDGDFSAWITELKRRAKIFGIHRETQLRMALILMNDLSAIVSSYDRSDTEERAKLGFPDVDSIIGWIRDVMLPEYEAVDAHFREHVQRFWTRG